MNSTSATDDAGPQRERDAVAGRDDRVGRDREQLPGAAGRDDRVAGPDLQRRAVGSSARTPTQRPPSTIRSTANHRSRTSTRSSACTAATSARSISAPVASPPAWTTRDDRVAAFAGERERGGRAVAGAVEHRAERHEVAHPVGTLGDEHPHRVGVAEPGAGGERVGEVQLGRVRRPRARPRRHPARTGWPRARARPS